MKREKCQFCGEKFHKKGIHNHRATCKARDNTVFDTRVVEDNNLNQARGEGFRAGRDETKQELSYKQQEVQVELVKAFSKIMDVFGQFAGTTSTIFGEWRR